jgi:hypothetical protein
MPGRADLERLYDDHAQAIFAFLLNLSRNEADTAICCRRSLLKLPSAR